MSDIEEGKRGDAQSQVDSAREFLEGILDRMGIDAEIEVTSLDDQVRLDIECEDVQRVIGRRGQMVDALQHLVVKHVAKETGTMRGKPVVVDAGGYRDREIERLQSLAERMAEKAIREGEPVELSPMSAHDRRIVHMALADMAGVKTESEGEGDLRHVVVLPEAESEQSPPAE